MNAVVEFIKANLVPGSFAFLMIAVSLGIPGLFLDERWRRRSRTWLAGILAAYWLLSLPACASTLEAGLDGGVAPLSATQADEFGLRAIVILGGGIGAYREEGRILTTLSDSTAERVLEGARLYRLLGEPWVIVSGGGEGGSPPGNGEVTESRAMRQALVSLGVSDARILEEPASSDTRQEALNIHKDFEDLLSEPFALVTSPAHMRRALAAFRAVGLQAIPSPARGSRTSPPPGLRAIVPSLDALSTSSFAIREYMALGYYAFRGWTSGP